MLVVTIRRPLRPMSRASAGQSVFALERRSAAACLTSRAATSKDRYWTARCSTRRVTSRERTLSTRSRSPRSRRPATPSSCPRDRVWPTAAQSSTPTATPAASRGMSTALKAPNCLFRPARLSHSSYTRPRLSALSSLHRAKSVAAPARHTRSSQDRPIYSV